MKHHQTELSSLLQNWRVTSPLPPYFREQVWERIECVEAPAWERGQLVRACRAWLAVVFARPAFALAYVTVLVIAGVTLGFVQANERTADWDRQLEGLYVQAVDPYQRVP